MDMAVNKPRSDIGPSQVDFDFAAIRANARDCLSINSNVSLVNLSRKHVNNPGPFENQISRLFPPRDFY
jgi:hypothetical protein